MKFKKKESNEEALLDAYKDVFAGPEGALVLQDILKQTRHNEDVFNADQAINSYQQGKQSVGLYIVKKLTKQK